MKIEKNFIVNGSANRKMAADIFYSPDGKPKPVVIYAHGYNGFKDWGNFDLVAGCFAEAGFVFIKFNFSHNGTTPQQPEEFADLDAYAENNYSRQLFDLQRMIDWCLDPSNPHSKNIDVSRLFLLGHSLGGGMVILKASHERAVKAIATWASVAEARTPWGNWPEERMREWKKSGIQYYLNQRTAQQLPLRYQLYQDYFDHQEEFNILQKMAGLNIPVLLCHGTNDEAVPVEKAHQLHDANPASTLFLVESDHVFGRKHPWQESGLPPAMKQVVERTIDFFKNISFVA